MKAYNVSGVMVLKDGQVVLERYAQGWQPTDRWMSQSVAKSVTSLLSLLKTWSAPFSYCERAALKDFSVTGRISHLY
jgi:hypothetical protein